MIEGKQLRDAYISAANNIGNRRQEVDALNVFPVPDGDTGTNMSMTMGASVRELALMEEPTVAAVAQTAASALLRGARGNSGVILSLLFRGFAKGLAGKTAANGADFANALSLGVEAAYKAVMKPTEGTILTVSRVAAERARLMAKKTDDPLAVWEEILSAAGEALEETPELLPVLKKAGVVDAGGRGLVVIFEGMLSVLRDGKIIQNVEQKESAPEENDLFRNAAGEFDDDIRFTYCTEFIVEKKEDCGDSLKLRAYLESIGDCVVVVDDDEIIKVHVHTDTPDKALGEGLKYGPLLSVKVENMRAQHEALLQEAMAESMGERKVAPPENRYGFVAVAAGEGLSSVFADLGVDSMVEGGQTMNPSTEDILNAIDATPAEIVFVLPNNKNIIMASEQAAPLSEKQVVVLPTKTIPQGLCAMLAFDPDVDLTVNETNMTRAIAAVRTGQITYAARDSEYEGRNIKEGDFMALADGKLIHTNRKFEAVVKKLASELADKKSTFITVIYGEGADEAQAQTVAEALQKEAKNAEIQIVFGGQPVYSYIISVE